jgi:NADP-dependent 3-hydroxy acid dehydrogenase YdfG
VARRNRSLAGRVVAITGAARGIGRATAEALVREGAKVAIGDLDAEQAARTADEIGATAFALDVVDRESFADFIDSVERELGPLDVLVNNAGIMLVGWPFADEDDATTRKMVDVNLHGVLNGTKLALERMRPRRSGHIVNISSQAGNGGFPGGATYSATKFAVRGFSEAVRNELVLEEQPIEISCVMPTVVNTELGAGLPDARGVRLVEPQEVAAAIVGALVSPRFDVHVPRYTGAINALAGMLPRRGREALGRFLKADQILWEADHRRRSGYEARAQASDPTGDRSESPV